MKKTHITLLLVGVMCSNLYAQPKSIIYGNLTYFDSVTIADGSKMLPPPPEKNTVAFALDEYYYQQGKKERTTSRGEEAKLDAVIKGDAFIARFDEAFGFPITKEETPELYRLLMTMKETAATLATEMAKNGFKRQRPFLYYAEHTLTAEEDSDLAKSYSYPSGHATLFHATSLVLQEINPDRQVEIMNCGYEKARSRIIVGAHWYSDVEAGRLIAGTIVARLHTHKDFIKQLKRAKREFRKKKDKFKK